MSRMRFRMMNGIQDLSSGPRSILKAKVSITLVETTRS